MPVSCPLPRRLIALPMLAFTALLGCSAEPASTDATRGESLPAPTPSPQAATLVGQLLLPGDGGRRGVELHVWVTAPNGEVRQLWVLPEADGRFAREITGVPTRVSVSAGSEVHSIEAADLPSADAMGDIDLGEIDLREQLLMHRVRLRATDSSPGGVVRVGLWIGPPHTGPRGELPSLGSKQFPPFELGSDVDWLLPPKSSAVYFLVERPDGPDHTINWRSGKQQVFGPYDSSAFPLVLVLTE